MRRRRKRHRLLLALALLQICTTCLALNELREEEQVASKGDLRTLSSRVLVEAGQTAELACHLHGSERSTDEDDLVSLIFWYKDDNPVPIYTLDARQAQLMVRLEEGADKKASLIGRRPIGSKNERLLAAARHHHSPATKAPGVSSSRLSFDTSSTFPVLRLRLEQTSGTDSGRYRCRVDFKHSPTINQHVSLLVQVPPSGLELVSSAKKIAQLNGTLAVIEANEDERLDFVCTIRQGSPPPRLVWLLASAEQSADFQQLRETDSQLVGGTAGTGSRLQLGPLDRQQHWNARVGCLASQVSPTDWFEQLERPNATHENDQSQGEETGRLNGSPGEMIDDFLTSERQDGKQNNGRPSDQASGQSAPDHRSKWLQLKLNLKPMRVKIEATNRAEINGSKELSVELPETGQVELVCRSFGSRPAPKITWHWLGRDHIEATQLNRLYVTESSAAIEQKPAEGQREIASWSKLLLDGLTWRDHQAELVCMATNEAMPIDRPDRAISVSLKVLVKFKPVLRLSQIGRESARDLSSEVSGQTLLGHELEAKLRCWVRSNPPINQLVWLVNEQPLAKIMATGQLGAGSSMEAVSGSSPVDLAEFGSDMGPTMGSEGELLSASAWTLVPLTRLDGRFRVAAWNELAVISGNSSAPDREPARFQCLAINELGQTMSSEVSPEFPYLPHCRRQQAKSNVSLEELGELLGHEIDQITVMASNDNLDQIFSCPVEADPKPSEFSWSYVSLEELTHLSSFQSNPVASGQVSQNSGSRAELTRAELMSLSTSGRGFSRGGLLVCRARNQLGWQTHRACINLLLHTSNTEPLDRPSAENCTMDTQLESAHVTLDVDCSKTQSQERLIFQLAVVRQDKLAKDLPDRATKRFLFSTAERHARLRVSMAEVVSGSNQSEVSVVTHAERRRTANESEPSPMSLKEQVDLLRQLVFLIKATDLISTSETRAIYGSDLQGKLKEQMQAAQTSRSTSDQAEPVNLAGKSHNLSQGRSILASFRVPSLTKSGTGRSPYEFEMGITIAAICGVVILSCLTLTLIFILLRRGNYASTRARCGQIDKEKTPFKTAQRETVHIDRSPISRTSPNHVQSATTCDMLALPAVKDKNHTQVAELSSLSSRPSLVSPYNQIVFRHSPGSQLSLAETCLSLSRGTVKGLTQPGYADQGAKVAKDTLYLIEPVAIKTASDSCDTRSPTLTNSPECNAFIHLTECDHFHQSQGQGQINYCSSSNHNSSSFCDEHSLAATLTTSDLAIVPEMVNFSSNVSSYSYF